MNKHYVLKPVIMQREIKFKFWLGHTGKMTYAHSLAEVGKIIPEFTPDIIPLQFTGLLDKHGVEIYEGDVLKDVFETGTPQIVIYDIDRFLVKGSGVRLSSFCFKNEIEIIGNVFTHPELVKP